MVGLFLCWLALEQGALTFYCHSRADQLYDSFQECADDRDRLIEFKRKTWFCKPLFLTGGGRLI